MRIVLAISGYLAVATLIVFGASQGARWLVTPDPTLTSSDPPAAPSIPPRIAESIERKKAFAREPLQATAEPVRPMTEAAASLTTQPQQV
jgi:hypothetical protein